MSAAFSLLNRFYLRFIRMLSPQVDLGVPKMVRGVITQGARGGDAGSGATTDNRAFVRKYKIAHSLNAKDWNFIPDVKTSMPKVGDRGRKGTAGLRGSP